MNILSLLSLSLLGVSVFTGVALTQTVTETRVFQQEVFEHGPGSNISLTPIFDLGLQNPPDLSTNEVVDVRINLEVEWDIHLRVANLSHLPSGTSGQTSVFSFVENMWFLPKFGDCSPYTHMPLNDATELLAPGDVGEIQVQMTTPMNVSWEEGYFNVGCENNVWPWADLWMGSVWIGPPGPLTYSGGQSVPKSWVRVLSYRATVSGSLQVEYVSNPVPYQIVCPGDWPYELVPGPNYNALWLYQPSAPDSFNILLQSTHAQSIPGTSLCVGGGTVPVTRHFGSLSHGGQPYLLPNSVSFSGTTQYFQAWFRHPYSLPPRFSECIGVNFP